MRVSALSRPKRRRLLVWADALAEYVGGLTADDGEVERGENDRAH